MTPGPQPGLVLGLGSPDRGDDGVGPVVALRVAAARVPQVEVDLREEPTDLALRWSRHDTVVVVEATRSGADPGSIVVLETGLEQAPFADRAWTRPGCRGPHAAALVAALEGSRTRGALPRRLVLVGVEGESYEYGAELSTPVRRALAPAVRVVLDAMRTNDQEVHHG